MMHGPIRIRFLRVVTSLYLFSYQWRPFPGRLLNVNNKFLSLFFYFIFGFECCSQTNSVYRFFSEHVSVSNEVKSKSKGKNTFNGFNRSNCEQCYISFFYIVTLQHNAFVISFNQFLYSCQEEAFRLRDVDGRPERPSSVTRVRPDLNLSTHS